MSLRKCQHPSGMVTAFTIFLQLTKVNCFIAIKFLLMLGNGGIVFELRSIFVGNGLVVLLFSVKLVLQQRLLAADECQSEIKV